MQQTRSRGIPCLLVYDENGTLKGKISGAPGSPDGFIQLVNQLANGLVR